MVISIIFDLDGTLTYTLEDLHLSTNFALRKMGWAERSMEEVRQFVGNGVRRLVERAVPQGVTPEEVDECFRLFREHYLVHCQDHTTLYEGVAEMLRRVHEMGLRTAIVSNKLQAGVDELYQMFFKDVVDVAIGERPEVRRKPAPDMVQLALAELGVKPEEALYVGDSEVDVETARNAGLRCVAVLWGFRDREQLTRAGADTFISHPSELLALIDGVRIREATAADVPAMLDIYAPYVRQTAISFEYEVPGEDEFRRRLTTVQERFPWLVAETADGRLLGYAYASALMKREAYKWSVETSIYVDSDSRGRGVGRALYAELEARLGQLGIRNMYACVAYTEEESEYLTHQSVAFHGRLGFRQVGRFQRCGYKFDRWFDVVWMEKFVPNGK